MILISSKALKFQLRDNKNEVVETFVLRRNTQTECPKWIKKDPLYTLAVKEGLITWIQQPNKSIVVEEIKEVEKTEPKAKTKTKTVQNGKVTEV